MTTRLKRKLFVTLLAVSSIGLLVLGKRHSVRSCKFCVVITIPHTYLLTASYLPDSVFDVLYHERKQSRWDDDSQALIKKPKFHLLIGTATNKSDHLCKTLLSAAILNYPPPTLLQYENEEQIVPNINAFLLGKEIRDDDLVLVVS
ncbi:hypothetical protein B0J14DRAFT_60975 [Halenospora varia]|nr:hypothetical protein B0J14DRAFT_60975 [Halenospora varia]